jgi:hypothetical protein
MAVLLEVDSHPLSERELKDLTYLARRPRLGRRVDRDREEMRADRPSSALIGGPEPPHHKATRPVTHIRERGRKNR